MAPRVLVVYKEKNLNSAMIRGTAAEWRRLLRAGHPEAAALHRADKVHGAALARVARTLDRLGVDYVLRTRFKVRGGRCDLAVSVGGDGTFLQAARHLAVPILGVNSNAERSEGVYAAATPENFERIIKQALDGSLKARRLPRLWMELNGKRLPHLALNDILVTDPHPATMSRYLLRVDGREEAQKSSGLWIATPSGCSGAVAAAGGKRMAWSARRYQFRIREPYQGRLSKPALTGGICGAEQTISIAWFNAAGRAYVDGAAGPSAPLRFADVLRVGLDFEHCVTVLG